jgi:hypothetical protein
VAESKRELVVASQTTPVNPAWDTGFVAKSRVENRRQRAGYSRLLTFHIRVRTLAAFRDEAVEQPIKK